MAKTIRAVYLEDCSGKSKEKILGGVAYERKDVFFNI